MTKTVGVTFEDRLVWIYDEPLGVLLKYLIDITVERSLDQSQAWQPKISAWRAIAALGGNVGLDLDSYDQHWQPHEYPVFCSLLADASERIAARGPIPVEEAQHWRVLDDLPPVIRSLHEVDTEACAVVADALIALVTRTLPLEPPGATWFIGSPGGTRSIRYHGRFVALPQRLVDTIDPPGARTMRPTTHRLALSDGRVVGGQLRRTEGALGVISRADPPFLTADIVRIDPYHWKDAPRTAPQP